MKNSATETPVHAIGLDFARNSFSLHGFDEAGHTALAKDLKRGQVGFPPARE